MRTFKLVGALIAVLAFGALGVANASAAEKLWKLLPGSVGETFTAKSGTATLTSGGLVITCKKSTVTLANGTLLEEGATKKQDATLASATIDFEECTSAGLAVNSVGDAAKTILVKATTHNCVIKSKEKETKVEVESWGLLFKIEQVHLEVPAAGKLILIRGAVIALVEGAKEGAKALTYKLNLKVNAAKEQEIQKCEGGEVNKLEASAESTEKPKQEFLAATEEAKEGSITFDGTKDTTGEEAMV